MAAAGAPAQAKEALPVKPGPGVNCRLKAAVSPPFTVTDVEPGAAGEIVKAALTEELMAIVCGELGASSATVMNAARVPIVLGENETAMVQVAPTG